MKNMQELQVGGAADEAVTPDSASRGYINGLGISGKDKLEEVLQMALSWLRRLDASTSQGRSGRSSTVRKVQSLLSGATRIAIPCLDQGTMYHLICELFMSPIVLRHEHHLHL